MTLVRLKTGQTQVDRPAKNYDEAQDMVSTISEALKKKGYQINWATRVRLRMSRVILYNPVKKERVILSIEQA